MMHRTKSFPLLFKYTAREGTQVWQIWVQNSADGSATICTEYGLQGGKKILQKEKIAAGKNLGKVNATTPWQQACLEAEARWVKQLTRKGYGETVEASKLSKSVMPMLAKDISKEKNIDWHNAWSQPKLDGFRCLASRQGDKIVLLSRENKPILTMPHIQEELLWVVQSPGVILDGELYLHGHSFERLASAIKKPGPLSEKLEYHVYDTIAPKDYSSRYNTLSDLFKGRLDSCKLVETVLVANKEQLAFCQQRFLEDGYEGAMLRHGSTGYEAGKRSKSLLKVKTFSDKSFDIIDVKQGRGTHAGMAIFVCETEEGHHFDVLAPGTHEEKKAHWENWQTCVGRRLIVKYQNFTTSEEPVPRFPVAKAFEE